MTALATDNLAELIRKKHVILVQLRDIGMRQQKLVDESATMALLQLLGAKQHLIAALQMVERGLRPFQAEDPESRVWRSQADRSACATKAAECQQLLSEVMDLERAQEARMTERRDEVAQQLRRANTAHQAADAYQQHRGPHRRAVVADVPNADVRLDLLAGGR